MTRKTLQKMRSEENFGLFWQKINRLTADLDIAVPTLPRRRKMPKRFEVGNALPEFPSEPEDYYRRICFEGLDLIVQAISRVSSRKISMRGHLASYSLDSSNSVSVSCYICSLLPQLLKCFIIFNYTLHGICTYCPSYRTQ